MSTEAIQGTSPPQRAQFQDQQAKTVRDNPVQTPKTSQPLKEAQELDTQQNQERSELSVEDAVKRLTDFVGQSQSQISFSIDQESGMRIVKVLDSESQKVIRQFPSEEAIGIAKALDKLQGLLIRDKA